MVPNSDGGNKILVSISQNIAQITAGTSPDNFELVGQPIDRLGFDSGLWCFGGDISLTTAETLSLTLNVYDSSDKTNWGNAVAILAKTVIKTSSAGVTQHIAYQVSVDLQQFKRYIKFGETYDMSKSGTDVLTPSSKFIKTGAHSVPTTPTLAWIN